MIFQVEWTDVAEMEIQEIFMWLVGHSPTAAARWLEGPETAVNSLTEFPTRCPLAPENDAFAIYRGYRSLFTLVDAHNDGTLDTVRLLHVRHGARLRLGE